MPSDTHSETEPLAAWLRDLSGALAAGQSEEDGAPLPLAPDFAEVIQRVRDVLTVSEIAEVVGVKDRQVHHWAAGTHNPQGKSRGRLLGLFQVVSSLETQLSVDQIKVWLWSPQPELSGAIPIEQLKSGDASDVFSAARGLSLREELDDNHLVDIAREGNASAYDALVRRYRGFVRLKAASYSVLGPDIDDLVQEGLVGLYKAIRDFRGGKDSDFQSFATHCITRQIIAATKADAHYRGVDPKATGRQPENSGGKPDYASLEFKNFLSGLIDSLPDFERRVLSLYLDGHPYRRIAAELRVDIEDVDAAMTAAKTRVAETMVERDVSAK